MKTATIIACLRMKRQRSSTFTEEMTFRTGTILDPKSTRINATEEDRYFYDPPDCGHKGSSESSNFKESHTNTRKHNTYIQFKRNNPSTR